VGTLTGFKWLGNMAVEYEAKGYEFLFAYEVEIGFAVGNISYDKDGIRTAAIFSEMATQLAKENTSVFEHLQSLYARYGYFQMNTSYFFCYSGVTMAKIFDNLRTMNNGTYPKQCGPFPVKSIRDISKGYDSGKKGNKTTLPVMTDSHMITFRFENGAVATLRNSGTEPKLKYYVECSSMESESRARSLVDEMTSAIIKVFLEPEKNGLVAKKAS